MSAPGEGLNCDCWIATTRIISQLEAPFKHSLFSTQPLVRTMSLSDMLNLGQNLVQHWEIMNGCPNSEIHLSPPMLRLMTDAIRRVLALYEIAIEGEPHASETREPQSHHDTANSPSATLPSVFNSNSIPIGNRAESSRSLSWSATPTFVGSLKLEEEEEIAIVGQEALRHSIIRLGAMLQDIEEETRQNSPDWLSDAERPLLDKEVKGLIGRLFRLLGKVNALASNTRL
ncbi:hypothetical protein FQN54_009206 [Arachnomyces sp. PD_36]|nr:hypothetical protein FQN54_009206 [Arachnomyces sp. PD_36]